jgi:hypothetical protein
VFLSPKGANTAKTIKKDGNDEPTGPHDIRTGPSRRQPPRYRHCVEGKLYHIGIKPRLSHSINNEREIPHRKSLSQLLHFLEVNVMNALVIFD